MSRIKKFGLTAVLALSLNCSDELESIINTPTETENSCKSTLTRVPMPPPGEPVDWSQGDQFCLDYNPFQPICSKELLSGNIHSAVYTNNEGDCSSMGRAEDQYYAQLGITARDANRGTFIQNNPLGYLRNLAPLYFSEPNTGLCFSIKPIKDFTTIYEVTGGSELVDRDFVAVDEYGRYKVYGGCDDSGPHGTEQLSSIQIHVSHLTARGQCNLAGIFSDIARLTAIGIDDQYSPEWSRTYRADPDYGTRLASSARWVQQENGNYVFLSEDRAAWVSNEYLIEISFPYSQLSPFIQDFSNPLIIQVLREAFPSSISREYYYDSMLAAINTFKSHRESLLENECIPPATQSEAGIYSLEE